MSTAAPNKMGTRPVFPLLVAMSFPTMISMLIQSLYNIVDSIFVARISENALTAVSLAFPLQSLILAVSVGMGIGLNSLIARRIGEGDREGANCAATHGILLSLIAWVLFVVLGLSFIPSFFRLFTDSQEIFRMSCDYTTICVVFSFGVLVHITIEKIFQSTGNMTAPMIMQGVGAVINIICDPIFIFGLFGVPAMGVAGAAVATVIGQITAMALSLLIFFLGKHEVKIQLRGFRLHGRTIKDILAVGVPSMVMNALGSFLIMALNSLLISFSNLAVSVFGVYFKLQSFVFMPVSGLTQGALPIMGFNYGARLRQRLMQTVRLSLILAGIIVAVGTVIFLVFPQFLLGMFDTTGDMLPLGVPALRILCLGFLPSIFGVIFATFFQAVGKGGRSLVIFLLRQCLITLPLAFLLAYTPLGVLGVWIAFPVSEVVAAVVSVFFYRRTLREDAVLSAGDAASASGETV